MCGIAGFYSTNSFFQNDEIHAMLKSIAHRGPDAEGIFKKDDVVLGHKRLSIIDLSEEANQPKVSHSGNSVIFLTEKFTILKKLH